jgi:succinylglutamate desuccinylase
MSQKLKTLFIGCCTHGDEQVGLQLAKYYPKGITQYWQYQTIICNLKATLANIRFIEQDLNRSFPGIENGNYEQNRAFEITKLLQKSDFIIDIHQTTAQGNTCLIVNKLSELNKKMIEYVDIKNVIIDNLETNNFEFSILTNAVGGLCLDSVFPEKSMTIEYSQNNKPIEEFATLEKDFINFTNQKQVFDDKKYYTFVGQLLQKDYKGVSQLQNFVELTMDQKLEYGLESHLQIYPCFICEKAYNDIYCFWIKKVVIVIKLEF